MKTPNSRWRAKNPEAYAAHILLASALRRGALVRGACAVCGSAKVHGHHNDYTKPLDVIWLCARHHRQLHALDAGQSLHDATQRKEPRPGRTKYMPAHKRDRLMGSAVAMRAEGKAYRDISAAIGVSQGTVYKWINDTKYK